MAEPEIKLIIAAYTEGLKKGFNEASKETKGFAKNIKNTSEQTRRFSSVLQGMGLAIGQFALKSMVRLGQAVVGLGKNVIMSAARVQEMDGILRNLGTTQGYTEKQMKEFTASVVEAGIRTDVAQNLIAQLVRAQMDLADAADLARVAQDAATLSGVDSSEALARITQGVMRHNVLILRTAGINISAEQAYADYARTIGKTAKELTEADKSQAFMNAVMKEGENIAGSYEAAMKAPGKLLRSMPRYFYEIGLEMGKSFLRPFGDALFTLKEFVKALKDAFSEGGILAPAMEKLGHIVGALVKYLSDAASAWLVTRQEMEKFGIEGTDTGQAVEQAGGKIYATFKAIGAGIRAVVAQTKFWFELVTSIFPALKDAFAGGIAGWRAIGAAILGNTEAARGYLSTMYDHFAALRGKVGEIMQLQIDAFAAAKTATSGEAFRQAEQDFSSFIANYVQGIEEAKESTADWAKSVEAAAAKIEVAEQEMAAAIMEINKEVQKKIADLTIQETWRAIDAQIAAQRKLEDEERQSAKRRIQIQAQYATAVAQALQQYQMAVIQAAKDRGERLAEIERDYQKRLRDIQRNYEVSAEDAIKSRDALALVTAQRQRDRELQEAKEARDEAANDAERQYQKQLEAAKEALRQQQEAAQEAMRQQMEELILALQEQEEEEEIAATRAAEDAERARARELGAIKTWQGSMLNSVDDTNKAELKAMTDHYDALIAKRREYYRRMAAAKSGRSGSSKSSGVQAMQHGGSGIVTQPTLFLAGEAGPEKYKFTPLQGGQVASGGTGGTRASVQQNFSFSGSMSEDERQWFRQVARQQADAALSDALS